jgi:hypothetical protein
VAVGGRVLGTTAEHPFWVRGRGWVAASQLRAGDALRSPDGQWVAVEGVRDTGREEVVYNGRVAEYHTYFVGCEGWGFSVWAHNSCGPGGAPATAGRISLPVIEQPAIGRTRFPLGERIPGERPVGSPVVEGRHNAIAAVTGPDGQIRLVRQLVSGESNPASFERLMPGRRYRATDTEARLATRVRLFEGETMSILGQQSPCTSCRGFMIRAAETYRANYSYQWWEGGRLRVWEARWDGRTVRVNEF